MNRFAHLLAMSMMTLALVSCGNDTENKSPVPQVSKDENTGVSPINNVIDCAQYPSADAQRYADEYSPECQQWAQSRGYRDGVVLPMDTAAKEVKLASDPLTCPEVKSGNAGYYCICLDKVSK